MGNLQIKNVPDEVHEQLRRRAGAAGTTVRDYVLALIHRALAVPSKEEWLRRLAARSSEQVTSAREVLAEERGRR
jgi:antitoxin FitA